MSSSPPPDDCWDLAQSQSDLESTQSSSDALKTRKRRRIRRRASGTLLLMAGLVAAGGVAAAVAPAPQIASAAPDQTAQIAEGKQLYDTSCLSCHGSNLQGIQGRGPSLVGVGDAAVYFQVSSGRMPATRNEAQESRKPAKFSEAQTDALGAYIQSIGGGPTVIRNKDGKIMGDELIKEGNVATGSELFRLNCASCHNFTGRGGALSSGKYAPPLDGVPPQEIYTAMLSGPENMPKFSDRQLTPQEKKDIISFIHLATTSNSQGGYDLGGFGPVSEGMAMWALGVVALVGAAMWIGSRS